MGWTGREGRDSNMCPSCVEMGQELDGVCISIVLACSSSSCCEWVVDTTRDRQFVPFLERGGSGNARVICARCQSIRAIVSCIVYRGWQHDIV